MTPKELKSTELYKIPIIGLFRNKLVCSCFASDVQYPDFAGLSKNCKGKDRPRNHDFAMLILKASLMEVVKNIARIAKLP